MTLVSLAETISTVTTLKSSLKATREAMSIPAVDASDELCATLEPFLIIAEPQGTKLVAMSADLQAEITTTIAYFGCNKDETKAEDLFNTILSFSNTLQKAAAEMTKHVLQPEIKRMAPSAGNGSTALLHAAARRESQASSGSVETIKQEKKEGLLAGIRVGTLGRGDLDEAIRSIHGGVRRRERREASTIGRGVRLSKMFLDGGGSVRGHPSGKA
jgi:diaphanous 1